MPDDRRSNSHGLRQVDMQPERRILAVVEFDHTGNTNEVHPGAKIEAADDRRARENQYREPLVFLDQGMGDCTATTQVTQPERVVAVYQHPDAIHTISHTAPFEISFKSCPRAPVALNFFFRTA